jgi:hypothetical protein
MGLVVLALVVLAAVYFFRGHSQATKELVTTATANLAPVKEQVKAAYSETRSQFEEQKTQRMIADVEQRLATLKERETEQGVSEEQ